MTSGDLTSIVDTALGQFGKYASRFDELRQHFPTTGSWKPCSGTQVQLWLKGVSWSTGTAWAVDVDKQTFLVSQFSDKTYTITCQQIGRLFIFHFTGVREMTLVQWQHLGNLIGFNAAGMVEEVAQTAPVVARSSYSSTGYVPPWEKQSSITVTNTPAARAQEVSRAPSRPGATKRVWEIADSMPGASRGAIIAVCEKEGINKNTAGTQYSHWARARKG